MLPILQRRFRALENSKADMLAQLGRIPSNRLNDRPGQDRWSAAELISHIGKVEAAILDAVRQNLASQKSTVKLGDRVGSMIVRNVLRSPLRVKVPHGAETVLPEVGIDAAKAIEAWANTREQWRDLLQHARGPELKSGVFSHPKGGWFTLPETVLFLRLHHDHHRAQVDRIAKTLASADRIAA